MGHCAAVPHKGRASFQDSNDDDIFQYRIPSEGSTGRLFFETVRRTEANSVPRKSPAPTGDTPISKSI